MNIKMVFDVDGHQITVEQTQPTLIVDAKGDGRQTVAVPDWSRLVRLASCVVQCMTSTVRQEVNAMAAERGGQHYAPGGSL